MPKRRIWLGALLGAGSFAGTIFYRRRSARSRTRVDLYFDDGSMLSFATGSPTPTGCCRSPATCWRRRG